MVCVASISDCPKTPESILGSALSSNSESPPEFYLDSVPKSDSDPSTHSHATSGNDRRPPASCANIHLVTCPKFKVLTAVLFENSTTLRQWESEVARKVCWDTAFASSLPPPKSLIFEDRINDRHTGIQWTQPYAVAIYVLFGVIIVSLLAWRLFKYLRRRVCPTLMNISGEKQLILEIIAASQFNSSPFMLSEAELHSESFKQLVGRQSDPPGFRRYG